VPNLVSFAASIAELDHAEKSRTQSPIQSLNHPAYLMPQEDFVHQIACKYNKIIQNNSLEKIQTQQTQHRVTKNKMLTLKRNL